MLWWLECHTWPIFFAHFFADDSKKLATFWAKHLSATEKFYIVLSENGIVTVRLTVLEILRVEIPEKLLGQQIIQKSCIFKGWHLADDSSKPNNP